MRRTTSAKKKTRVDDERVEGEGAVQDLVKGTLYKRGSMTPRDISRFYVLKSDKKLLYWASELAYSQARGSSSIGTIAKAAVEAPGIIVVNTAHREHRLFIKDGDVGAWTAAINKLFPPPEKRSFATELAAIAAVVDSSPDNRAAKHFDVDYFNSLSEDLQARHIEIVRSGFENADSSMGAYAMNPDDYDTFKPFMLKVICDYHNVSEDAVHVNNWSLKGIKGIPRSGKLDLKVLGVGALSMRVRVGRNLNDFPLPGAMTADDRRNLETKMLGIFNKLISLKEFGGTYSSLTPGHPNFVDQAQYQKLVDDHIMFKDMDADAYLKSAGIASDWPIGRGAYCSEDKGFIIWVGEEDHLRIMCMQKGSLLNQVFDRLKSVLDMIDKFKGLSFGKSRWAGYVTSCPTNLGTGMRASVHIPLPKLTKNGTDVSEAKRIAKSLGLSVRGAGGEHTAAGAGGVVDISPSARFCIKESEIIVALFKGIQQLYDAEKKTPKPAVVDPAEKADDGKDVGSAVEPDVATAEYTAIVDEVLQEAVDESVAEASKDTVAAFVTDTTATILDEALKKAVDDFKADGNTVIKEGWLTELPSGDYSFESGLLDCRNTNPDVYKVVAKLDGARVVEMTLPAGMFDAPHDNPAHLMYMVKGGKLSIKTPQPVGSTWPDWANEDVDMPTGSSHVMPAGPRQVTNIGDTEVKAIFVETYQASLPPVSDDIMDTFVSPLTLPQYDKVGESDQWFAGKLTLAVGERDAPHSHRPLAMYVLSGDQITVYDGMEEHGEDGFMKLPISPGFAMTMEAGHRHIRNSGTTEAVIVFFEQN